jgi:hypothetical protein
MKSKQSVLPLIIVAVSFLGACAPLDPSDHRLEATPNPPMSRLETQPISPGPELGQPVEPEPGPAPEPQKPSDAVPKVSDDEMQMARRLAVRLEFLNNHPDSLRLSGESFLNQVCFELSGKAVDAIALNDRRALRAEAKDEVGLIEVKLPGLRVPIRPIDMPSDALDCRKELGPQTDIDPCRLTRLKARNADSCGRIKEHLVRVSDGGD